MARSNTLGVAVLAAVLLFGAAVVLDFHGLQERLFAELAPGGPNKVVVAKLPERPVSAAPAQPVTDAWYLDASGFEGGELEQRAARASMVVYFQKARCDDCRRFEREVLAAPAVKSFLGGVVKVRVDAEASGRELRLSRRFGVERLPAIVAVPLHGPPHLVPVRRDKLFVSPPELISFLR